MRALIVDDEPLARARLRRLLADCPQVAVVGEAGDTRTAESWLAAEPDVIFLDIEMPGERGIDWATRLRELVIPPAIIFTTAHPEHALDAFRSSPADYLLKPIEPERLRSALQRVCQTTRAQQEQEPTLTVQIGRQRRLVRASELIAVFAEQKYARVVFEGGEALVGSSLKELETLFGAQVLRIHRNTLINRQRLVAISNDAQGRHYADLRGLATRPEISRRALRSVRIQLEGTD